MIPKVSKPHIDVLLCIENKKKLYMNQGKDTLKNIQGGYTHGTKY